MERNEAVIIYIYIYDIYIYLSLAIHLGRRLSGLVVRRSNDGLYTPMLPETSPAPVQV